MSSPSQHFHFYRNGAVSTGSHSVTQAGTGHTAHLNHPEGADLAIVVPVLRDLVREIGMLTSAKARDTLAVQAAAAEAEAVKEKPDPDRIKSALEAIKSGAAVLEEGGKIIALCNKAYNFLAPLLGLPPSPLP
jgi:hypothetical protein